MKLPFFTAAAALLSASVAFCANLVPNSSFECGTSGFAVISNLLIGKQNIPAESAIDETTAVHGGCSLKIDNRKSAAFIELRSGTVPIVSGQEYTLSVYLKADKPTNVTMFISNHEHEIGKPDGIRDRWMGKRRTFKATPEWQRFSFTEFLQTPHTRTTLILDFSAPAVVWVDAMQFEVGKTLSDYKPVAPVEAGFVVSDSLFFKGKHPVSLYAANYGENAKQGTLDTSVGSVKFELAPHSRAVYHPVFSADRYGLFDLSGTVRTKDFESRIIPVTCAVVSPLPAYPGKGFFLGANAGGREELLRHNHPHDPFYGKLIYHEMPEFSMDTYHRNLRLAGNHMLRMHDSSYPRWQTLEPEKGKFQWEGLDVIIDSAVKNGLEPMFVLGNGAVSGAIDNEAKDWFVRKNSKRASDKYVFINRKSYSWLPDKKDWADFISALVTRYKGRMKYYEVINEPNGVMPNPDHYYEYLKLSYETIKRIDPDAVVVGICSTGDFGGKVREYMEEILKRGGGKYLDVISFHPYDAPLDNSINSAEKQIDDVKQIVAKYCPGVPLLQDELYYIEPTGKLTYFDGTYGWPAGNLIRRYAFDMAGGLIGSVSILGWQFERGDALHADAVHLGRFTLQYTPNEKFIAANAFARFLEGGSFLVKPSINSRLNSFVFLDRNGNEVALLWAKEKSDSCSFTVPSEVDAYDLFGNPLPSGTIELNENPIYLTGKQLKEKLEASHFEMNKPFTVLGAAVSSANDRRSVAVEILNRKSTALDLTARLKGVAQKVKCAIAPDSVGCIYFPTDAEIQNAELLIADEDRIHKLAIPVVSHPLAESGKMQKIGDFVQFTPEAQTDALVFHIRVTDKSRSARVQEEPWMEDCIEFFFDAQPDSKLSQSKYTEDVRRLFLVPRSKDGKPAKLSGSINADCTSVRWQLQEDSDGYSVEIRIPWQFFGLVEPSPIAFDLTVSDFDSGKKVKSGSWAGDSQNFMNRLNFGRLLLK